MKREKLNTLSERDIIYQLIVSDKFCREIIPVLNPKLLEIVYVRTIAIWIKDYFQKFKEAPKKNMIKLASLVTVFAFGLGLAINTQKQPISVSAEQHITNYADYTYSGNYYSSLNTSGTDGLTGTFLNALYAHIFPKAWYTYSGNSSGTLGQELQKADEDPTNSSNMVLLYTRDSITKTTAKVNNVDVWNREHVWPQANSNDCWGTDKGGTDLLHLRPTYVKTNSARGNLKYGYVTGNPSPLKYEGMTYGYSGGGYFEPLDSVKGDVARIVMYVYAAYNTYYGNKLNITSTFASYDTLLKWHTADKPDAMEGHRNDYVESSNQKNRNPFVDHPEYAWRIFGDSCSASVKNECIAAYPGEGGSSQQGSSSSNPAQSSNPVSSSAAQSSAVAPVAGQYSVVFKTNDADGTSAIDSDNILSSQASSNTLVESVSASTKVFAGKSGIKLGSSSAAGSITLSLKSAATSNIERVEVESAKYGSDTGTLTIKLDSNIIGNEIEPGTKFQKDLNNVSASTITISTSTKRAYISKVIVVIADSSSQQSSSEPISSNEPDISSEEPIASSEEPAISSEESIITSETAVSCEPAPVSQPQEPTPTEEPKKEKGCGGSIVASLSFISLSALISLVFIFDKRRH